MNQEQMTAAVERFHRAVTVRPHRDELLAATRGLLEALAATAQQLVTQAVAVLIERQDEQARRLDELERRQELLQREIAALNVRADERDGSRSRVIGE
jgi:hypothetical protein